MRRMLRLIFGWIVVAELTSLASIAQEPANPSWPADAVVRFWTEPIAASGASWFPQPIEERVGHVVEFDDKQFVAQLAGDDSEFAAAAKRIFWIEPLAAPASELAALKQFNAGDYDAALRPLVAAISVRPPVWRQQWLSVVAAQAALRSGRYKIALELVSQIDRRPLPPLVIGWLPVVWQTQPNDATMQSIAAERLNDASPATRLVAASWLLSSGSRAQATTVLEQLAVNAERSQIAMLAKALLWQVAPPPEVDASVDAWFSELNSMPMALQTGPTLTLIGKLKRSGKSELARPLEQSLTLTPIQPHPDARLVQ